jgi:hypothetical protein
MVVVTGNIDQCSGVSLPKLAGDGPQIVRRKRNGNGQAGQLTDRRTGREAFDDNDAGGRDILPRSKHAHASGQHAAPRQAFAAIRADAEHAEHAEQPGALEIGDGDQQIALTAPILRLLLTGEDGERTCIVEQRAVRFDLLAEKVRVLDRLRTGLG